MDQRTSWQLAFLAILSVISLMNGIYKKEFWNFNKDIYSRIRPLMVLECLGIVVLVITLFMCLYQIPFLKYGWISLIFGIRPTSGESTPITYYHLFFGTTIYAMVLSCLPGWAYNEEMAFREGAIRWNKITKNSIIFGIAHLPMGVPLAAVIALMSAGFFFAIKYRNTFIKLRDMPILTDGWEHIEASSSEAIKVSTTYHLTYNIIVITMVYLAYII